MEIFSICLSSRSSCCPFCCCSLLICVACRFRFWFYVIVNLRRRRRRCHRLGLRFALICGFGKWFHYFLCCLWFNYKKNYIIIIHTCTHRRTCVRVLLSAIIYMTCGLYDSTQGEILEELRFRFRFHNTHTTESAFRGVVSLINRHTSLCR